MDCFCQLCIQFRGTGAHFPHGRLLGFGKEASGLAASQRAPDEWIASALEAKVKAAAELRQSLGLPRADTNVYRLINRWVRLKSLGLLRKAA